MIEVYDSVIKGLGFDLDAAILNYQQALIDFQTSVDEPRPVAHPLVEEIVAAGGEYRVLLDNGATTDNQAEPEYGMDEPMPKDELIDWLANRRWEIETAGITVDGILVATDDRSKMLILATRTRAKEDPTLTKKWKAANGSWIMLAAPQLIMIADLVDYFVTLCFDAEGTVTDLIMGGRVKTKRQAEVELLSKIPRVFGG